MHLGPAITTNLFVCVRVPLKLLIQIYYYNFIWRRENTATNYFTDSIISHTYVKIPGVSQLYYLNNLSWPRRQEANIMSFMRIPRFDSTEMSSAELFLKKPYSSSFSNQLCFVIWWSEPRSGKFKEATNEIFNNSAKCHQCFMKVLWLQKCCSII